MRIEQRLADVNAAEAGSLDDLATGLPKNGDVFSDGSRFVDDASHWSFSFVIVIPIAPF